MCFVLLQVAVVSPDPVRSCVGCKGGWSVFTRKAVASVWNCTRPGDRAGWGADSPLTHTARSGAPAPRPRFLRNAISARDVFAVSGVKVSRRFCQALVRISLLLSVAFLG